MSARSRGSKINRAPLSVDFDRKRHEAIRPTAWILWCGGVAVDRPIRLADDAYLEVVRPSASEGCVEDHDLCPILRLLYWPKEE
jgi:hypothetical protein